MKESAAGAVIPSLPEKKVLGNIGEAFVAKRKKEGTPELFETISGWPVGLLPHQTEPDDNFKELKKMREGTGGRDLEGPWRGSKKEWLAGTGVPWLDSWAR